MLCQPSGLWVGLSHGGSCQICHQLETDNMRPFWPILHSLRPMQSRMRMGLTIIGCGLNILHISPHWACDLHTLDVHNLLILGKPYQPRKSCPSSHLNACHSCCHILPHQPQPTALLPCQVHIPMICREPHCLFIRVLTAVEATREGDGVGDATTRGRGAGQQLTSVMNLKGANL
jgi:hypothetical protein